jgi:hypothetical protein
VDIAAAPSAARAAHATAHATTAPAGTASQLVASAAESSVSPRRQARRKPSRAVNTRVLTCGTARGVKAPGEDAPLVPRLCTHQREVHGRHAKLRGRETTRDRDVHEERHASGERS